MIQLSMGWHSEVHPGLVLERETEERTVQEWDLVPYNKAVIQF